jgi:glutamate-1-semialdehyde 2,1-aminomutase
MVAGLATLAALTDESYARLEATGAALESGIREAIAESGREACVSRVGSLLTLFFLAEPPRNADEALTADRDAYARFFAAMLDAGVLLPPSQFEAWFVSLAHGSREVETTLAAVRKALAA